MTTNPLSQKAMLASLAISQWTARKLDRAITDEVGERHHAVKDHGRYNKLLVPKAALKEIQQIVSEARSYHITFTQPWLDQGTRLLPAKLYEEYSAKMRGFRIAFERAADLFADNFQRHVDARAVALNGLYDPRDYPKQSEVRGLFAFGVMYAPCPDASDFRVSLGEGLADDLRQQIEADMQSALDHAMREPLRRTVEVVGRMAERLRTFKPSEGNGRAEGVFRDSLITNVEELVRLFPAFNLRDDPQLTALAQEIEDKLCSESASDLREHGQVRKDVAADAEQILSRVNDLLA